MEEESKICKFYKAQNVLVTGGTGFIGKILIEKLLRSTDVATIFMLIREKRGKHLAERLDNFFDNVVFDRLKKERPQFKNRVVGVTGDCVITGLNLTITDRLKLAKVNIVFHCAATVRFDENIKNAYSVNVNGTISVIELCRHMKSLKAMVHVSTAYSNCHLRTIEETFYDYTVNYETVGSMLDKMSQNEADKNTARILGNWPNTYTFTKALAESFIRKNTEGLPVGIFRPAIVISTYREPEECWTDNMNGPGGVVASSAFGLLRVLPCNEEMLAELVPVDSCVAGMIAAAWDIASKTAEKAVTNIPIYNYVSSNENPLSWGEFHTLSKNNVNKYPLRRAIWTTIFMSIKNPKLYCISKILLHLIPAFIFDFCSIIFGKKPRFVSMYGRIHKFSDVIAYFCTREWIFANDNVVKLWRKMNNTDRELFPLSITTVLWLSYFRKYFKGIRVFLIKDPLTTLEEAKAKQMKFDLAHNILKFFVNFVAVTLIWFVIFYTISFLI